jgi:hypothetical protein
LLGVGFVTSLGEKPRLMTTKEITPSLSLDRFKPGKSRRLVPARLTMFEEDAMAMKLAQEPG